MDIAEFTKISNAVAQRKGYTGAVTDTDRLRLLEAARDLVATFEESSREIEAAIAKVAPVGDAAGPLVQQIEAQRKRIADAATAERKERLRHEDLVFQGKA